MKITRKKLQYIPGLISLVLLPLLGCLYILHELQLRDYRVIEINWWHSDWKEDIPAGLYPFDVCPTRNYLTTNLSTDPTEKTKQLDSFQRNAEQLLLTKDTTNGLHIKLSDHSTFGDFIAILNILLKVRARTYVAKDNDIWVFNFYPVQNPHPRKDRILECSVVGFAPDISENNMQSQLQSGFNQSMKIWPIFALFGLLVVLTATKKSNP